MYYIVISGIKLCITKALIGITGAGGGGGGEH